MKTLIGVHPNKDRYTLALVGVLLLIAISAWAVTPIEAAKLLPDDGAPNDFFGFSVALSGDTAVIGATKVDDNIRGVNVGAAYVFTRSGNSWHQQARLTADDGEAKDQFGGKVAVSGDTAVIGAMFQDDKGDNSGSAYVFTRSGSTWSQQARLTAADLFTYDEERVLGCKDRYGQAAVWSSLANRAQRLAGYFSA